MLENEEYLEKYHSYLRQLADEYIYGGGFDTFYDRTRSQIDSLVESDPTAFYSYEEYDTAAETLYEIVQLRGTSIQGQLDGTIPSLESEQRDSDALVDASHLDVSVMGSMSMGDSLWGQTPGNGEDIEENGEDVEENKKDAEENREDAEENRDGVEETGSGGTAPQMLSLSSQNGGFDPSQFGGGELPEDFDPSQFGGRELPEDFDPSQFGGGELPEDFDPSQFGGGDSMPGMDFGGSTGASATENLILYGACFAILIIALIFAKLYRRRPRRR